MRLAHGRRLRRRYEFTDSRVTLRQAAATFTMMGAEARVTRITAGVAGLGERADALAPDASWPGRGGGPAQLAGNCGSPGSPGVGCQPSDRRRAGPVAPHDRRVPVPDLFPGSA
ncbi:hypothetical protein [Streptomyces sp. KL116D]|uniref:hypothetical protein n=1 Tax=Streptomyces sp. KL116D TaxID=3045152 RepID=UPI0035566A0E